MEIIDTDGQPLRRADSRLKLDILTLALGSRDPSRPAHSARGRQDIAHDICDAAMKMTEAAITAGDVELADSRSAMASRRPTGRETRSWNGKPRRKPARSTPSNCGSPLSRRPSIRFRAIRPTPTRISRRGNGSASSKVSGTKGFPCLPRGAIRPWRIWPKWISPRPATRSSRSPWPTPGGTWGKRKFREQGRHLGRARHWYQQAVDKTVGLDKARIQKRLQEETALAPAAGKSSGRESIVNVTNLPFVGKSVVEGKPHNIVVDSLEMRTDTSCFHLPSPAKVKHFFSLHASSEVEINLESRN